MEEIRPLSDKPAVAVVFLGVFGLFAVACFLPCIDCGGSSGGGEDWDFFGERGRHPGLELLLLGWTGGNNGVPWSANVFLFLGYGCFVFRRYRTAVVLGLIATCLGLTTWWVRRYDTLVIGYYAWQASQVLLTAGAWLAFRGKIERRQVQDAAPTG